jgi:hypothetical protein
MPESGHLTLLLGLMAKTASECTFRDFIRPFSRSLMARNTALKRCLVDRIYPGSSTKRFPGTDRLQSRALEWRKGPHHAGIEESIFKGWVALEKLLPKKLRIRHPTVKGHVYEKTRRRVGETEGGDGGLGHCYEGWRRARGQIWQI